MVILVLFLPILIKQWWHCTPLPRTEKRERIEAFFKKAGYKFKDILKWNILEGQMMTAGVMGLIPGFRYILVTDSLLSILSEEEINAVMAHEIGHIRYKHILFLLSFIGISIGLINVIYYLSVTQPFLLNLMYSRNQYNEGIFYALLSLPVILSVILYFRYIMGFFMRNFERQADLFSAKLTGNVEPIISALEKIALFSGQGRDQPSWHHFSIAERVDCLWKYFADPQLFKRHSRRVVFFLTLFFVIVVSIVYTLNFSSLKTNQENRFLVKALNRELVTSPDNINIYRSLAYIYQTENKLLRAIWAYENILELKPDDTLSLNNLAWILATSDNADLLDYPRALKLAEKAILLERSPTILDTLAEACYVNGHYRRALETSKEALDGAIENRNYFEDQLKKFERGKVSGGE